MNMEKDDLVKRLQNTIDEAHVGGHEPSMIRVSIFTLEAVIDALSRRDEATVVVPRESTPKMQNAGVQALDRCGLEGSLLGCADVYRAMLAAAQGEGKP